MKKKYKTIFLKIIGIFFLIWGIIAIINSVYNQNPSQILYLCYIGLILIGIGILAENSFIIMSQVYILLIPLIVWDIDFIYWLIFQNPLWGVTDYFFLDKAFNIGKIISLQHLFTIPLSVYAAKLIGLKRKDAWKWSFIQIFIVFITVSLFSPEESNVNCIFKPCMNIELTPPYKITWFIAIFSMTFLSSLIINKILFKGNFRINNRKRVQGKPASFLSRLAKYNFA